MPTPENLATDATVAIMLADGFETVEALAAADQLAHRPEFAGKTIVTLLPDTGERYLSTPLYSAYLD